MTRLWGDIMAQKAITIYTPAADDPHINAEDDAQIYRGIFGGSGITEADNVLACTKIDNNTVRLDSGSYVNQGYVVCVEGGTTADLTVTSGSVGYYRKDYVVAEFTRGGGETADAHVFKVVAGTPAETEGAAVYPTLTADSLIGGGGTTRQEALYGLAISGTTLSATITRIADYVGSYYA